MKRIPYLIIIFLSFLFLTENVYATSGCCSSHGGVDCSRIQPNGNVVCNDGTTGSTCSYSSMKKCQGYIKVQPEISEKTETYIYGCTDDTAKNYNSRANKENGSCEYFIYGCTDKESINYNINAEKDDGNCIIKVSGCVDSKAINYNINANIDDGNCEYKKERESEQTYENMKNNISETFKEEPKVIEEIGTGLATIGTVGIVSYIFIKKIKK